jgi:hypothetical protein
MESRNSDDPSLARYAAERVTFSGGRIAGAMALTQSYDTG